MAKKAYAQALVLPINCLLGGQTMESQKSTVFFWTSLGIHKFCDVLHHLNSPRDSKNKYVGEPCGSIRLARSDFDQPDDLVAERATWLTGTDDHPPSPAQIYVF